MLLAEKRKQDDYELKRLILKVKHGEKKMEISPSGNRTPVSRVTGGDTYPYTNEDHIHFISKYMISGFLTIS